MSGYKRLEKEVEAGLRVGKGCAWGVLALMILIGIASVIASI
jgi:hypothetical protein